VSTGAVRLWGRETLQTEGIALKALLYWLGLSLIGSVCMPVLPFLFMFGGATKIVRAVYSIIVIIPVIVLFQVNMIVYLIIALFNVQPNYNGALYGAVKWIERKKIYSPFDETKKS
jgi:uncharacterized protein YybS (DUF2232 family)